MFVNGNTKKRAIMPSKEFINQNFLLSNKTAQEIYHKYAEGKPILDLHCHLDQKNIAQNKSFDNSGDMWLGAAWWFSDQKNGMKRHLEDSSVLSLLSRFIGMGTDSRSFLSYPRHEYFRRIACNFIGEEVEKRLIPNNEEILKMVVEGLSYNNAKSYFNL